MDKTSHSVRAARGETVEDPPHPFLPYYLSEYPWSADFIPLEAGTLKLALLFSDKGYRWVFLSRFVGALR